jgi:hypothetical protein
MATGHITDVLKPSIIKKHIGDDLVFADTNLQKDFLGFMQHVICRAEHYSDKDELRSPPLKTSSNAAGSGPSQEMAGPFNGLGRHSKTTTGSTKRANSFADGKKLTPSDCLNP